MRTETMLVTSIGHYRSNEDIEKINEKVEAFIKGTDLELQCIEIDTEDEWIVSQQNVKLKANTSVEIYAVNTITFKNKEEQGAE